MQVIDSAHTLAPAEQYLRAIWRARADATPVLIDGGDFTQEHGRIPLLAEDVANRRSDLPRREFRRRDLIEQRLKEMVIRAVDQNHIGRCTTQGLGGREAAEAAADDDDSCACVAHGSVEPP